MQGRALLALCREYQVPLIINDHLDLALALDADGLHLGGDDGSVAEARARLGPGKILGASCYDRLETRAGGRSGWARLRRFRRLLSRPASSRARCARRSPCCGEAKQRLSAAGGGDRRHHAR